MAEILGTPITVTQTESIFDRLKSACCGIVFGIILFLGAFPLLYWNEQRAVERYDALNEGESQVLSISSPPLTIDPQNEGKLVHFTATVYNGGANIVDSLFGIGCTNTSDCLSLQRHSEMYQWEERSETKTKTNAGGSKTTTTTYTYERAWSSQLINSDSFHDQSSQYDNPTYFRFPSEEFVANPMMAGSYQLPSGIVNYMISDEDPMDVSVNDIVDQNLRSEAKATGSTRGDGYYFGTEQSPTIGDEKVWFSETPSSQISVVGVQKDNTVTAFVSETGRGGNVLLYRRGNLTATELFDIAEDQNRYLTIGLRILGFVVMALGQILIWSPLKVVADVIPVVGSFVGCGIKWISITIAAVLSSITISIAWLIVHPKIGLIVLGSLLAVIGAVAFAVKMLCNRKKSSDEDDYSDEKKDNTCDDDIVACDPDPEIGGGGGNFADALGEPPSAD